MAMKAVLLCAVGLAVLQISFAQNKECGEGEVWKTGQSSSCGENKCGDPEDGFKPCTMDYVSRCFCEDSLYRRSSDNKCVPKEEC
ncbi:serine protease inhibitor 2 [Rhipicephalus sanguineus]|uniref:serine protease inhibitor 2 n=1 Tax=Rhipicephalus sanguineus TaxID=34632 RepID=UPI0018940664|nr:serine protease inhibitor 2 [Rhipicephalus sanguineus]